MQLDIRDIADKADMIINGYAFRSNLCAFIMLKYVIYLWVNMKQYCQAK